MLITDFSPDPLSIKVNSIRLIFIIFKQWSLGITLWELATLGASPLAELDAADVGAFLDGGYRPSQPHNCPDEL